MSLLSRNPFVMMMALGCIEASRARQPRPLTVDEAREAGLLDLYNALKDTGMALVSVEEVMDSARQKLDDGATMAQVLGQYMPAPPTREMFMSPDRPKYTPCEWSLEQQARPAKSPRYRCPKCEATADTNKRCRPCGVKMTSRKR